MLLYPIVAVILSPALALKGVSNLHITFKLAFRNGDRLVAVAAAVEVHTGNLAVRASPGCVFGKVCRIILHAYARTDLIVDHDVVNLSHEIAVEGVRSLTVGHHDKRIDVYAAVAFDGEHGI